MSQQAPAKLRRVEKTDEEYEKEEEMFFNVPRKTCKEVNPAMFRLAESTNKRDQQHRVHLLANIMKRARISNIKDRLKNILDFDRSELIIPDGEVSKRVYTDIFTQRDFDLYGNQIPKKRLSEREQDEMRMLARELGIEFTRKQVKVCVYLLLLCILFHTHSFISNV